MKKNNKKSQASLNVFNKLAKQYVEYFDGDWEFINEIDEFASFFNNGDTIIDLGSGSGYITDYLVKKGLNTIGIDNSSEMINIAKETYPNIKFILDDILNIESYFKENELAGAIAIYSLYFIPREYFNNFLKSLSKILKPGAKLLFVTEIGDGESYIKTPLIIENNLHEGLYMNCYMKEQLEEILNNNNFSIDYLKEKIATDEKEATDSGRYIVLVTNNK